MTDETKVQELERWIAGETLGEMDLDGFLALFTGMCKRIDTELFPIFRCHITMQTLHTFFDHNDFSWYRSGQLNSSALPRSESPRDTWRSSPLFQMLENFLPELRLDMKDPDNIDRYPLFKNLSCFEVSDYFALLISFGKRDKAIERRDGLIVSWITDVENGFTDEQIVILKRLTTQFATAAKLFKREQTLDNVLNAYLGKRPSAEILSGATQRGDGSRTKAAIWVCDLRKSTELAFKLDEQEYLSLLNRFLEFMAKPVLENGGEILKFMGDGFLAIFPVENEKNAQLAAQNALEAALSVERAFDNTFKREGVSGFGIGIHLGEVMFGNIGTLERLDFSVIGPAVNIASRLQELTKNLPARILATKEIAEKMDLPFVHFPNQEIRGSNLVLDLYSPRDK